MCKTKTFVNYTDTSDQSDRVPTQNVVFVRNEFIMNVIVLKKYHVGLAIKLTMGENIVQIQC